MQRIGAGTLRGRVLRPLPAAIAGLRPTGSKVRGAIFDRLHLGLPDMVVLDLFGGSGALTIEALSRGAARATMFEQHPKVLAHLRTQLREFALEDRVRLFAGDACELLRRPVAVLGGPFSLVLVDPPYAITTAVLPIVAARLSGGLLVPGATLVCGYDRATRLPAWPAGFTVETSRHYGQAGVDFVRWDGGSSR
ncbi:MAG: 23S rRNA (adenine(2030)-N(6))-methyltransferase RlmJ [Nannocystis sp.]|uniref:RsmD family RNA methyltransferase n=1 Tax=Nannocystis sp. TaxID=1962667 RepID=UPI0024290AD1|nr:RsmD family RNA methyltransferase [Nannocystis sp.]MBK9754164.1 23S rRNA (adenine(2030)-N(6))-methyltransferase RlmJ [Nannocystis sp.]